MTLVLAEAAKNINTAAAEINTFKLNKMIPGATLEMSFTRYLANHDIYRFCYSHIIL